MNDGYAIVLLSDMLEELGEIKTQEILSEFSCAKNKDVETFLKKKAILFSKSGIAQTHLVFYIKENKKIFVGYFALAIKNFEIELSRRQVSSKLNNRLHKFVIYDQNSKTYRMSAILIGQLGKNFSEGNDHLISGDELLQLACNKVKDVQRIAGGKFVYLECEDKKSLVNFYEKNGFLNFGKRLLDRDESDDFTGRYLIQMIKYLG